MDQITKMNKKSILREYAEAFIIAILLALFIRTFIIQAFKIPSGSMKSTLLIGDHLLVNKFIYGIKMPYIDNYLIQLNKPERGDVVVFKYPEDENTDFIKRVIGVAGDIVEIKDDQLYINNEKIVTKLIGKYSDEEMPYSDVYEETIGNKKHKILNMSDDHEYFGPVTVPEDSIFVMGDNRDNSHDSRKWKNTNFVKLEKIKGKALIIYWSWPHWNRFFNIIK
jgi:signal peptidase I